MSTAPRPKAASKKITAWPTLPAEATTIVDRAVATKSALPRPQPARKPTIAPMLSDIPASAEKTMIRVRPAMRVRLAPMREEMKPATSIATPMIAM